MAKLVSITETAEAITAEASAYVWEEYDAPRKRVKRVRPIEHAFAVSIPKVTEEAAPLAFVVEYFPQVLDNFKTGTHKYRSGYDQQVRYSSGKFYTPARFDRHPYYTGAYIDPRGELERAVNNINDIAPYDITELLEQASRDEIRTDKWHYYGHVTAEYIDDEAANACNGLIVINGELWHECDEPVYVYHASDSWHGNKYNARITVSTDSTSWGYSNGAGALDRIAMAFYWADVARCAYIDVKRPDLVTIDSTARNLEKERDRQQRYTDEAAENVKSLEKKLQEAREQLAQERGTLAARAARLETYQRNPLDYWRKRIGDANESAFARIRRNAEAAAHLVEKEA